MFNDSNSSSFSAEKTVDLIEKISKIELKLATLRQEKK